MKTHVLQSNKTGIMCGLLMIWSCIICLTPVQADIYYWTDSDGVIHFSNHNPPAKAQFFMVEQPPDETASNETKSEAALPKRDPLAAKLAEANNKLDEALSKVDELAEKVEQSRQDARNAAEAARQAQAEAKLAAEKESERTVVYGVPYRLRPHKPYPKPGYWKHDTSKYPYYHNAENRPHHRPGAPGGKPEQFRSPGSGLSVQFNRNGSRIQGRLEKSSGANNGPYR